MRQQSRFVVLLFGCIALARLQQTKATCPAAYGATDSPLLMGGTYGSCTSGCQPRTSVWSDICKLNPDDYNIWGVCENWQRQHSADLAAALPGFNDLSPCDLYDLIGNRTLWIIGDSHVKGLWYSLRCFMVDLWNHTEGECAASDNITLQTQLELTSLQGHPYNTPPRCIHLRGSRGRLCMVHSPIGDYYVSEDQQVPGTLQLLVDQFTSPQDIIYISIGRWHANNCEGIHPSYQTSLHKIGAFVQGNRNVMPNVLFGVAPHDHTNCEGRELIFDVPSCLPADQGGYDIGMTLQLPAIAHEILAHQYGVPVIDYYNTTMLLFDGHITAAQSIGGIIDCLHFCRPGLGEINVWAIYSAIKTIGLSPETADGTALSPYKCVPVAPVLPKPFGPATVNIYPGPVTGVQRAVGRDAWGSHIQQNR